MVMFAQLIIALLTGPAQAADRIALVCSGTQTLEDRVPRRITGQTLTMDWESKTVTGFLGDLAIKDRLFSILVGQQHCHLFTLPRKITMREGDRTRNANTLLSRLDNKAEEQRARPSRRSQASATLQRQRPSSPQIHAREGTMTRRSHGQRRNNGPRSAQSRVKSLVPAGQARASSDCQKRGASDA